MGTYWSGNGRYQGLADALERLIPPQGPAKGAALERLRVGINAYHDLFNNGGGNRNDDIYRLTGVEAESPGAGSIEWYGGNKRLMRRAEKAAEPAMDRLILEAAEEQIHKLAGGK